MEPLRENPSLAFEIFLSFQNSLKDMKVELCESGDKKIIVVDYTPVRLEYIPSPDSTETLEQIAYRNFWNTYRKLTESNNMRGENLSSQGYTDLIDVRAITSAKNETVYMMPRAEWEKLQGRSFELKFEGIANKIRQWIQKNPRYC